MRNTLKVEEVTAGPRVRKAKPKVVICFEWWHRYHAMYRSYARSIAQLRKDFHVVGMSPMACETEAKAIFDEWIQVNADNMVLSSVAEQIKTIAPDIIYYPSIGMSVWVIAMASLRLAPIQMMSYGHPATTHSPVIDYGIIEADTFNVDRFAEKIITLPPNTVRPTEFQPIATRHTPRRGNVMRIAVSAMQVKVSWPFVQAMQEVCRRAEKKIEFHFFAAVNGVGMHSFLNEMSRLLPNVTVQQSQPYHEYMETMAKCDLALFSFPFGGTNSMIDSMVLGLPSVTMLGNEPHSMSDTALIRRAGLPESLVCKSVNDYVEAVLKMQNDDYRALTAELVRGVDVQKRFFQPDDSEAFLNVFKRIYDENTTQEVQQQPV
jgi:predicted O-linked N-acetylglucosamine transferase (SPINDLY family)